MALVSMGLYRTPLPVSAAVFGVCVLWSTVTFCADASEVVFEDDEGPLCPAHHPHCISVHQCPTAIQAIRRGLHPTICDWMGTTPHVCCPSGTQEHRTTTESSAGETATAAVATTRPPSWSSTIGSTKPPEEEPEEPPEEERPTTTSSKVPFGVHTTESGRHTSDGREPGVREEGPGFAVCGVRPGGKRGRRGTGEDENSFTFGSLRLHSRRLVPSQLAASEPRTTNTLDNADPSFYVNEENVDILAQRGWPWVASLEHSREPARRCAGVLLDRRHVLTAAQCLGADFRDNMSVRLSIAGETSGRRILEGTSHPDYAYPDGYNDVAIVEFSPALEPNQLSPICLPTVISQRRSFNDMLLDVVELSDEQQGSVTEHKYRELPVERCNASYAGVLLSPYTNGVSDDEFICAELKKRTDEECIGVPGSPLMVKKRGLWTLAGIYNFGIACSGSTTYPTVFTSIAPYVTWIYENLGLRR